MSSRVYGIDIGSRSIGLVVLGEEGVEHSLSVPTTYDVLKQCRAVLEGVSGCLAVATGYGRKLFLKEFGVPGRFGRVLDITEIQAHALGARALYPTARTVLDIGGQDTKVIAMTPGGKVVRFEMNDRCAAGTGKFLEFMATALQTPLDRFGGFALGADKRIAISSMCTVFAETEATTLMALGERAENIAMGLHLAIAGRVQSMIGRIGCEPPLVFSGGVARNPCIVRLLEEGLGMAPLIPRDPDLVGALGAALHGKALLSKQSSLEAV
ncbi:2-hydroxyisocaproyl-CoA dehydratase activator [Fundidesulfovibrio magnetotacticus]|uniref:2-hydroxyisocaproyl-CoA dehydratase activator n=1 Tax=Fundidesulfovibrio magnetotacticus TaxID=2730080 RepID=A0A6V8LI12_9BACT|nr:acyl-CoA dehydratase activase [Fundidesulfovibrio magnetotacticus]GFK92363.1 2-hydroxyisocaproyl-CoA dehydratase activator [Fundidesulfovibrio magnetotacticus]